MQKRISYYDVDWDRRSESGGIWLSFDDRTRADLRPLSVTEISMLCTILRSEKVVYYDPEAERISTQADPVDDDAK